MFIYPVVLYTSVRGWIGRIITENRDEVISRLLAREMLKQLKEMQPNEKRLFGFDEVTIELTKSAGKTMRTVGQTVSADFVKIVANPDFGDVQEFYFSLLRTLRHELEHVDQLQRNYTEPEYDLSQNSVEQMKAYMNDTNEIAAYASETYFFAKKRRISINDAFKSRLRMFNNYLKRTGADENVRFELLKSFRDKVFSEIKKRYPRAKF